MMKKKFFLSRSVATLFTLLAMPLMSLAQQEKNWQLVWSEEFDRAGRPDSTIWNYEQGLI